MSGAILHRPEPGRTYRVAQWATGRIGESSLAELIRSPEFELVGVLVHSEEKAGRDAGDLCGRPATGVIATRDLDDIIAARPDCVVMNAEGPNVDGICRLLAAGINVATSRVDYLAPARMDPDTRARVEAACRTGGASIHATGASPGFSSEALPLVVASMSRTMERMTVDEYADIPASCPDFQCAAMGFGRAPGGEFDPGLLAHIGHGFEQSVSVIADGLGLTLDDIRVSGETASARERFLLPGGTAVEAGTVAAQRITIAGSSGGRELVLYRLNWYVTTDIDRDWDLRRSGWRLLVEGETPIDVNVTFPVAKERVSPAMAAITAYRVINAVPFVCAAEPGIRTTTELPNIVPRMR